MDRIALYAGTRNIYHDMVVSAKSLLYHHGADRIIFLTEDDTFPEPLPDCITTLNVSNQQYFPSSGPNFRSRWTYMVMMRVALTKQFPDISRILTLDHDTIVLKPVDYLWNIDLSNKYFAAVEEKQITTRTHPYYNFGVVMHNLDLLRKDQADDVIINSLNIAYFTFCEQDAVNSLFRNKIFPLPQAYNAMLFSKPPVPDGDVCIRHYAANGHLLHSDQAFKFFDSLSWDQILNHKAHTPMPRTLLTRHDVINQFISDRDFRSFLEIGTDTGISIRKISADIIVSVDPDTSTPATHHMTSDDYFSHCRSNFDIIFIDGLHEHNQAYRDIQNALKHLNKNGVIIVHDCLPTTEMMQRNTGFYPGGVWTGDVWKAFVKARKDSPYLCYTITTDFGCGVIDTSIPNQSDLSHLPDDMELMTYDQFVTNRNDWMNTKEGIVYA